MFSLQTKFSMARALLTKNSPFYIQFYIAKYCHQKCKMCNIVEANQDLDPFDPDKIEKIAKNLVKIGAGVVLLTGGEPFLRPDIDVIVKIFKQNKLDVRMQTAGLYHRKDLIAKCVENGARDINVSIDSLDEPLSDYINGLPQSWRNAMKTIAFINRTFPPNDSVCALGCVLSNYNIDEIDAVLDFATEIGWWLSLVPVHITSTASPMNFRGYDDYFRFQEKDFPKIRALIQRLKKKKKEGYALFDSNDYLDSIYHFITTGRPNWRKNDLCDTPNLYFAVLPDGRFAPCCDFRHKDKIYVYDDNFPEIYKSGEFREKVKGTSKKCTGCNFGSYPEMTLSARSPSTLKERLLLQFKTKFRNLRPLEEDEIFEVIEKVKKRYPEIYSGPRPGPYRDKKHWPKAPNIPERLWEK